VIRGSYFKIVIGLALTLVVVSAIAIGLALWRLHEDAISDATQASQNIATILAEQASNSSQAIELVLDEIITEIHRRGSSDVANYEQDLRTKEIYDFLKVRLSRLPQAEIAAIVGNNGILLDTTREWPTPAVDLSSRDYFQHFSSARDDGLFVSEPTLSKVTGAWTVYFSKRLTNADGQNLGVVVIGIRPEAFLRTTTAVISAIPGEVVVLLRKDGTLLLRHPDPIERIGEKMPASSDWYRLVRRGGGNYRSPGFFDGQPRWVSVQPLQRYSLVVDVSTSETQILAAWRTHAFMAVALSVIVEVCFALLLRLLYRQFGRVLESEAKLAEKSNELSLANARFDAALSNMSHGVAMYDRDGCLMIHNRKFEQLWGSRGKDLCHGAPYPTPTIVRQTASVEGGVPPGAFLGRTELLGGESRATVLELFDGKSIRVTSDPMPDGGWVTTHEDISEGQRAQAKITHMAHHDALTELSNRARFMSRLQELIDNGRRDDFAVLLIDLDHFKEVNDTFGHLAGDGLLRHVAERLNASISSGDLLARLGGDEFAIVRGMDHSGVAGLESLAECILTSVHTPYFIGSNEVSVGLSIGVAVACPGADDPEQIMRHADLALYRAKAQGRNRFRVFESQMEEEFQSRQQMTRDLQDAIDRDELQVHYQPIVSAATFEIQTMEALARWSHPTHGMVSPKLFIELAEEAGLIHVLGEWVLRRACLDAVAWPTRIKVAVNVSAIQISQGSLPNIVASVLLDSGLPPERLELEITESVLLSDSGHALSILAALQSSGVSIVLDDFGTGYSSLSYLKTFTFDKIKIDKSFIDDISTSRGCAAIIAAVTTLARGFDILTTAEGVETREQCELLRAAALSQMQGYLFGKPAPASRWDFSRPLLAA
jgi:diguanylate cyclase (GGDEF)-like protein